MTTTVAEPRAAYPIPVGQFPLPDVPRATLDELRGRVDIAKSALLERFSAKLKVNVALSRTLVSYQANRGQPELRWCKYREGFSAELVKYVLQEVGPNRGKILDPFAGSGTTLFTAHASGLDAVGIELLPNSTELIEVRRQIRQTNRKQLAASISAFRHTRPWSTSGPISKFSHLRITKGAFPRETEHAIGRYLYELSQLESLAEQRLLTIAIMGILEDISYTRKDGQYLRWDRRSGRSNGRGRFEKAHIAGFDTAITSKLDEISQDLEIERLVDDEIQTLGQIDLYHGSCLERLPEMPTASIDGIITSPPYCNRYDYTRTYALELALLKVGESRIKELRQSMLTCTVENREKWGIGRHFLDSVFQGALKAFEHQNALNTALEYLDLCKEKGLLNNSGIPRMVRNYFKEMAVVIFDSARLLRPGSPFVMVNDNVRYHGVEIPVDLILSDFAEQAGFDVEQIWVLPKGKGNSSQQMGVHGREELRKSVLIWKRCS